MQKKTSKEKRQYGGIEAERKHGGPVLLWSTIGGGGFGSVNGTMTALRREDNGKKGGLSSESKRDQQRWNFQFIAGPSGA